VASSDRSAVVSGASSGIGLEVSRALAEVGFKVFMLGRDRGRLDRAASEVTGATAVRCDVGDDASVAGAAEEIRKQLGGTPSLLVNNAGHFHIASIEKESIAEFSRMLDVNLTGAFRLVHAFLPIMRERGTGHIITIGSIADHSTFPGNAAYSASKFGSRALHEVLRAETRGSGVRASLISPGPVDTPIWDEIDPDAKPGFTPRAQMLSAQAVAEAVVWIATRPPESNIDELRISRS
jgi:NADP-dependent 3-hydroxy acid dehydrogenase YdfG